MINPTMAETPVASTSDLREIVGRAAAVLSSADFPTGERARLRRQDPVQPPGLAFYRFAFRYLPDDWERNPQAWMTLIAGMALMVPAVHRPDQPAGAALANAGYAEARLERLLAADGTTLQTLLLRAARFLAAKNAACNWVDFARLLLATDRDRQGAARLAIARAFYRHIKEKD